MSRDDLNGEEDDALKKRRKIADDRPVVKSTKDRQSRRSRIFAPYRVKLTHQIKILLLILILIY